MKSSRSSEISFRAIGLGLILIPINCYWLVISRQPYQYQAIPTIISPFFNVIFIIVVPVVAQSTLENNPPGSRVEPSGTHHGLHHVERNIGDSIFPDDADAGGL